MKRLILSVLFIFGAMGTIALATNEWHMPSNAIFHGTVTAKNLNSAGIVTNTSGGLLGTTSTVPLANGGTAADLSSASDGSIAYKSGTAFTTNTANLFWDITNKRLGVGTATPAAKEHILLSTSTQLGELIQGASSQTADLFQAQESHGTALVRIAADGKIYGDGSNITSIADANLSSNIPLKNAANAFSVGGQNITDSANSQVALTLKAHSTQTADLFEALKSTGTALMRIAADGKIYGDGSNITAIADSSLSSNVPLKNAANAFSVGGQTITDSANSQIGLTINAHSTQTADLFEVIKSTGTALMRIGADGKIYGDGSNITAISTSNVSGVLSMSNGGTGTDLSASSSGSIPYKVGTGLATNTANLFWDITNKRLGVGTVTPLSKLTVTPESTSLGIVSQGASSQTADLFQAQNSSGTALLRINSDGAIRTATASTVVPLAINGAASQTADLFQATNSNGTAVSRITADGHLYGDGSTLSGISGSISGLTAARIPFASNSTTLADTANLFWDMTNGMIATSAFKAPTVQEFTATGSTTGYLFTISTSTTCAVGDTYTNNSNTYTVLGALSAQSGQVLFMSQAAAPLASGTLTRSAGSGTSSITFSANVALGTYTLPSPAPKYLEITLIGGGGGGGGSGTSGTAGNGSAGTATYFGANFLSGGGGGAGGSASNSVDPGAGGTASKGTAIGSAIAGAYGGMGACGLGATGTRCAGGSGASSPLAGGPGGGGGGAPSSSVVANTGTGGPGGGAGGTGVFIGNGGSAGGFVDAIINSPSATYPIVVGTGGALGAAGTSGFAGKAGSDGRIRVRERYQ